MKYADFIFEELPGYRVQMKDASRGKTRKRSQTINAVLETFEIYSESVVCIWYD